MKFHITLFVGIISIFCLPTISFGWDAPAYVARLSSIGGGLNDRDKRSPAEEHPTTGKPVEETSKINPESKLAEGEQSNEVLEKNDHSKDDLKEIESTKKVASGSSELAKQVGSMLQTFTKRQIHLLQEIEEMKENLNQVLEKLEDSLEIEPKRNRVRRYANPNPQQQQYGDNIGPYGPYKACLQIQSLNDGRIHPFVQDVQAPSAASGRMQGQGFQQQYPPQPRSRYTPPPHVQEFMPTPRPPLPPPQYPPPPQASRQFPPNHPPLRGEVDLSQVYWVRMDPNKDQQQNQMRSRVQTLFEEKNHRGRDLLVIPISHEFKNADEVRNGFMRAVRVRPPASPQFRQLRSLTIREM